MAAPVGVLVLATRRVLVADPIAREGIDLLAAHAEVDVRLKLAPEALLAVIPDYHALVVRSETRVTEAVLAAGERLEIVARAGTGVDNVDVEAATRRGIIVVNAPDGNTRAVAEHTLALLLALLRHIPAAQASLRGGAWQRGRFLGAELGGKTLGVIGFGRIGREVAHRAAAFGLRVVAFDPFVSPEHIERRGATPLGLDELLREADVVSLHVPLTDKTRTLIGPRELALMRPTAVLVNCARGGLVDEAALAEAIEAGRLGGAALDVFAQEPPSPENPLLGLERVIVTPHIAGSTAEAQSRIALTVAEEIVALWSGKPLRWAVNAPVLPEEAAPEVALYADLAVLLGKLYTQLADRLPREIHVRYHGDLAALPDTAAITAAATAGLLAPISTVPVNWVNARHVAEERGLRIVESRDPAPVGNRTGLIAIGGPAGTLPTVAGAVCGGEPRFVELNGFRIDMLARPGHYLLTGHTDRPGMIGRVGTLLGENDINISAMHVGRNAPRDRAMMILALDEPIPDALMARLQAVDGIGQARVVTL